MNPLSVGSRIERPVLAVVGAGAMGTQLAALASLASYTVRLHDLEPAQLVRARAEIGLLLSRYVGEGRLGAVECAGALDRLLLTASLPGAVVDADLVVEAVVEELPVKLDLFTQVDRLAPRHAILVTCTSAWDAPLLSAATRRPERVVQIDLPGPPIQVEKAQVVESPGLLPDVREVVMELCRQMGRAPALRRDDV